MRRRGNLRTSRGKAHASDDTARTTKSAATCRPKLYSSGSLARPVWQPAPASSCRRNMVKGGAVRSRPADDPACTGNCICSYSEVKTSTRMVRAMSRMPTRFRRRQEARIVSLGGRFLGASAAAGLLLHHHSIVADSSCTRHPSGPMHSGDVNPIGRRAEGVVFGHAWRVLVLSTTAEVPRRRATRNALPPLHVLSSQNISNSGHHLPNSLPDYGGSQNALSILGYLLYSTTLPHPHAAPSLDPPQ